MLIKKRSFTLLELMMAVGFLGFVLLAVVAFQISSLDFLKSSETKAHLVQDISYLMDHIIKTVSQSHGWKDNPGVAVSSGPERVAVRIDQNTPLNFADDVIRGYVIAGNKLNYCASGYSISANTCSGGFETLSYRLDTTAVPASSFSLDAGNTALTVNLQGVFNPSKSPDARKNPRFSLRTTIFLCAHSW